MVPLHQGGDVWRAAGLKPWSESEFVFAAGKNTLLKGYAFKADWRTGAYERLTDVEINTHDVQKGYQGNAFWSALPSEEFQETCVDLGAACPKSSAMRISGVPRADVQDLNHIQALEDDAYLLISSRMTNTLYYVHAGNGSKIWALGGDDGDFGVVGYTGDYYAPGESYWLLPMNSALCWPTQ